MSAPLLEVYSKKEQLLVPLLQGTVSVPARAGRDGAEGHGEVCEHGKNACSWQKKRLHNMILAFPEHKWTPKAVISKGKSPFVNRLLGKSRIKGGTTIAAGLHG